MRIFEWRGVKGLVAAEVLSDGSGGISYGAPFPIAGTANVSVEVENSSETHFYDNYGAIVITAEGDTNVTVDTSGLDSEVYAKITGYTYDPYTGALIEGKRAVRYYALGYAYEDTDGHEWVRWFYKGMFQIPSATHVTMNNSTDANGQSVVYTAVRTAHQFTTADGTSGVKSMAIDGTLGLTDVSTFFDSVTTPAMITPSTTYELSKTVAQNTSLAISNVTTGEYLDDGDPIKGGDMLKIVVTNGTVTVNGEAFLSGSIYIVSGDTAVVTTYVPAG